MTILCQLCRKVLGKCLTLFGVNLITDSFSISCALGTNQYQGRQWSLTAHSVTHSHCPMLLLQKSFIPSSLRLMLIREKTMLWPVWPDWAILKVIGDKMSIKSSLNIRQLVIFWNFIFWSKNSCSYLFGNFWKNGLLLNPTSGHTGCDRGTICFTVHLIMIDIFEKVDIWHFTVTRLSRTKEQFDGDLNSGKFLVLKICMKMEVKTSVTKSWCFKTILGGIWKIEISP